MTVKFTYLIEGWNKETRNSSGLYWRGFGGITTTRDPHEALHVDQEPVAAQLVAMLNHFEPLAVHGVRGNWDAILHGFEGEELHIRYPSEDQIVTDLVAQMRASKDLPKLLDMGQRDQLGMLHHGWGMWIRNNYNLWHPDNPHTMKDYVPEVRDGVDYSPRHPDQVSMRIIERVYQTLAAERQV